MTILPKKKINSKEKGDAEANYHRQQRYNHGQRHGAAVGAPNDVARYPYSTVSSNLNYSSYANGHFVSSGISEARGGWYDNRDISQNLINNRQALAAQSASDEIHLGLTAYSTNSGGGVSKRKKKREANISASIASGKTVSRNTRIEHTNIEDSNENMDQQPCGSSTAPLKTGLPSPPHQNSEDEYDTQNEISSQERELRFERQLKAKKGFLIKKMKEDGACLFRAISDQIYGDQDMHSIIRNLVCDYMMKNRDFFQQFVTEDFNRYIERKRVDSEHGNHVELQAISEMYNRPIEIYIYDSEPSNVFQSSYRTDDLPIRLSYHNNIHYNSVYDPYAASVGVGLGLPSFTPGVAEKTQMKDAIRASESLYIEQAMYEDKLRLTDWEATSEAISEAVLRESRLQFLRDQEKKQQTQQGGSFTSITNNNTTSPRSSPGYTSSTYGNMTATSSTCGKPCCSYSTASPPLSNQREHKVGAGLLNYPSMDPAVSAESPHLSASCCFTKSCAINNIGNHQNKDQQGALSQRSSPLQPSNYQLRSMASSPKASHSPNSSGNKSPVLPIPLALQSNYNNMNGAGSNGVGTKLSQCPSPDYGAMGYLWPPNSPKVMYPNTGDFDASVGLGGVVGGVTDSQQQQPEYNLLRVLMESQLEYYNSFRSRNPARSPSQPQHSPQPGPSSTS